MRLFQPDHNLPGLQLLFDVDALADQIRSWMGEAGEFKLSIADIRYKPATSCLVKYVVETAGGSTFLHAKAFQKDDWLVRKQKFADDRGNHWRDDELAIVVIRFPADAEIEGIERLAENPQEFLAKVLPNRYPVEQFVDFTTLAYKPNRRFTARLEFGSGQDLVIKLHEPAAFERMMMTARSLDRLRDEVPSRIGQSRRNSALTYNWIDGESLDFSTANADRIEPLMGGVFDYLSRIQDAAKGRNIKLELANPAHGIEEIAEFLSRLYPPIAATARHIRDQILLHQQTNHQPKLVHGDFHESQVVVSENGIKAIDFDNCRLGDPTSDVANLLGHLHYRACLRQVTPNCVGLINELAIRNYHAINNCELINQFSWNQIRSLFRLATNPFRSGSEDWIKTTENLMEELTQQIQLANHRFSASQISVSASLTGKQPAKLGFPHDQTVPAAISNDSSFEFLADAFDFKTAERAIQRQVPKLAETYGNYKIRNIFLRRHKPGRRCLIEYELNTDKGRHSILGKASAKRLDRKSFATQSELFDVHGFGYDDDVAIPRPFGYCAQWNICFQEKVDATAGVEFLEQNQLKSVTGRIAVALAKLHSCNYRPSRRHTVADELNILDHRLKKMMLAIPQESQRIERILENCFAIGESINEQMAAPIHRDFYHDQIMFSHERTFLVDLDLVSLGHPALDVGNFLAHLSEHGVRQFNNPHHWLGEETEIINRYLARMPQLSNTDIDAFKTISFARHVFISWKIKDRRMGISKIIETADRMTSDLVSNSQRLRKLRVPS